MTTISIAMATYKGGPYIIEQLESIARQTILPMEVVITDDNSPDDTLARVAEFAAKAPFPVRYEKNEKQLGYRANFMKAANLCKGGLIAFCDQDDVWLPHKLEKCLAQFDNKDVLLTYHNATVVDGDLKPIGTLDGRGAPAAINPAQSIDAWAYGLGLTQICRQSLLAFADLWPGSHDFYLLNEREAQDQWFFFLASALGTIAYIKEPLLLYRQHQNNVTGWGGPSTLAKSIGPVFTLGLDSMKSRQIAAGYRAMVLEWAQKNFDARFATNATAGIKGYRKLENAYRMRLGLYTSKNPLFKFGQIIKLIKLGGYKPRQQWGVGYKAMLKDLVRSLQFF